MEVSILPLEAKFHFPSVSLWVRVRAILALEAIWLFELYLPLEAKWPLPYVLLVILIVQKS